MNERKKACVYLVAATFFLALMSAFARLAGDLPAGQKVFFRCLVMSLYGALLLRLSGERLHVEKRQWTPLLLRGVCGGLAMLLNFYAVDRLSLADANMLNKISPFFTVFFSFLLLGEAFSLHDLGALLLAFLGTACIVKPGSGVLALPALVGAMSGVISGLGTTFVRACAKAGASKEKVVLVYSLVAGLLALPLMLADYRPMAPGQLLALLACGLSSGVGHTLYTKAFACAGASEIVVFDYSQVLFAALIGLTLFGDRPDAWSLLGYVIIIGTGSAVFFSERSRKRKP